MIPQGAIQSVLHPSGSQAAHIHVVWSVFLWISVAVYAAVMVFLAAALLRRSRVENAPVPSARAGQAVIAASILSVIVLFGLLILSAREGHAISSLRSTDALKVRITGYQWWWKVEYPGSNPSEEFTTANEIHIPAGRDVKFELTSADVIHSFWVPALHGKMDLLPGRDTAIWVHADNPGVYRGQCAEFCGLQHAHMALVVFADPPEQFAAWLSQQRNPSSPAQTRGREIFEASCGVCHTVRGTGAGGRFGPDLTHLASRSTIAAGTLAFDHDNLVRWISRSQDVKPGTKMPAFAFNSSDLNDLTSFVEALR